MHGAVKYNSGDDDDGDRHHIALID